MQMNNPQTYRVDYLRDAVLTETEDDDNDGPWSPGDEHCHDDESQGSNPCQKAIQINEMF